MDPQEFWEDYQHLKREATKLRGSEERLKAIRARHAALLEATTGVVLVLDREGRILEANAAGLALLEMDEGELVGSTVLERFPDPKSRVLSERAIQVIASGEPVRFRWSLPRLQGAPLEFAAVATPVVDDSGRAVAAAVASEEVGVLLGLRDELADLAQTVQRLQKQIEDRLAPPG